MKNKKIIIGIDGNEANVEYRVGSGQYAFELLRQFKRENLPDIVFKIYLKDRPRFGMPEEDERWQYETFGPRKFWTQFALPIKLWSEKLLGRAPDVFFTPGHYAPRFCPVPSVIAIMDLAFFRFPEYFKKKDLWQLKNWTAYSIKQAKKILAISEATKKDVTDFFGRKAEDVVVTYPGYDKERFDKKYKSYKTYMEKKYKIFGDYILYVGTLQPRKNLVRLIEAFALARGKYPELKLVIAGMINVGRGGWMYENIFNKVEELNLKGDVIFTNYVPDEEVPILMSGAKAYILPSLFEGFGIPVVEAMARGTPVVISRISSLPEIGGEIAVYVEPENTESIKNGIIEAIEKPISREKLQTQARKFSWKTCAEKTLKILLKTAYDKN